MGTRFRMNGVVIDHDEPSTYLDQAHAVLKVLESAVCDPGELGEFNKQIIAAAVAGAGSLVELAAISVAAVEERRLDNRGACHAS